MREELDKLEIKVSYLESQNAELSDVVLQQGKEISHILVQLEEIKNKVKELMEQSNEERPSQRPPHY